MINKKFIKNSKKIIFWSAILSATVFSFSLASSLEFNDNLNNIYSGVFYNYSDLNFNQRWNNFEGTIFRRDYVNLSTPVSIDLWSFRLTCYKQVRWMYYNNQRWLRVWPLDQDTFLWLKSLNSDYNGLSLTGWWYFDCDWQDENYIFGQIVHTYSGVNYELLAWVRMNFASNTYYNYLDFSWSLKYSTFSWYIFDNYWWIALANKWIYNLYNPIDFFFDNIYDAQLNTLYKSDEVIVAWLPYNTTTVTAIVTNWDLFVNWTNVGNTYSVKNWDELQIRLRSSSKFNDSISSQLTVWTKSATFSVTTIASDYEYELTTSQKLQIILIVNTLVDYYKNDPAKQSQFINTFSSMLKDKIDIMKDDIENWNEALEELDVRKLAILEYLYDRLSEYVDEVMESTNDWDIYVAPNGKKYTILFDDDRQAYTSNNFVIKKYFATLDTMKDYIDKNNPANSGIVWNKIIAPNGKVYLIRNVVDWVWTSPDLNEIKYFYSFQALRDYIYEMNKKEVVRNHTVDVGFNKVTYTAPNGKVYDIYRTTTGKYFSYKMSTPIYFDSLTTIKKYINLYNKK